MLTPVTGLRGPDYSRAQWWNNHPRGPYAQHTLTLGALQGWTEWGVQGDRRGRRPPTLGVGNP
jgi:hypothetical protein